MPQYDFVCQACGVLAEEFLKMADCTNTDLFPKCGTCGRTMERAYTTAPSVPGNNFVPYFNQGLGRVVHSAREQDRIAKELGATPWEKRKP